MEYPRLIESGVRNYFHNALNKCHEYKSNIYSLTFNIGVFLVLVLTISIVLYFRKKGEMKPWEKEAKMLREQNYILSKIRQFQQDQKRQSTLITDLPTNVSGIAPREADFPTFVYNPDAGL
jgi:hypothetical protein